MTEVDLLRRAGVPFVLFAGEALIPLASTEAFVQACRSAAVPILGVDAFRVFGEQRQPDMGFDFVASSWPAGTRDEWARRTCDETLGFLQQLRVPDLYFVFVLDLPDVAHS